MSEPEAVPSVTDNQTAEELAHIPYEPLLPVEKQLIVGSLVLGILLLGVLLWISSTFFPIPAPASAAGAGDHSGKPGVTR